jgi:PIN domain nuclease of toxin-antitoxin system
MILLDTHVWIWFVSNPELLSEKAGKAIDASVEENAVFISSMSAWEVALLVARKRLELTLDVADWVAKSEMLPFIQFVPVDNDIAMKSVRLPEPFHHDPADRIIIASAISLGVPLLTKDRRIRQYPHVKTIW